MQEPSLSTHRTGLLQWKGYRTLEAFLNPVLAKHALVHSEWKLLGVVYDTRELQPARIARILDVKAPLVTRTLARLLGKKLIRIESHGRDRRIKRVNATAAGERKLILMEKDIRMMLAQVFRGVPPGKIRIYKEVLEAIIKNGAALGKKPD